MTHALVLRNSFPPGRVRRPRSPGLGTRRCFNTADDLIRAPSPYVSACRWLPLTECPHVSVTHRAPAKRRGHGHQYDPLRIGLASVMSCGGS